MTGSPEDFRISLRRNLLAAIAVIALLFAVAGAGSAVKVSGAVIADGKLVVRSEVKKVQHSTGGTIGEILVVNGQAVSAGDVVARLDATTARASLAIITTAMDELSAKRARLMAERDDLAEIDFGPDLNARHGEVNVGRVLATERRAFSLRRQAREGEKAQLRERIVQLREQVGGLQEQMGATEAELTLVRTDLEGVRAMWAKQLVQYSRLNSAERDAASLNGELGSIKATIGQTRARISETELQIYQVDQGLRGDVAKELTEVDSSLSELAERRVAAQDLLNRIDIRAPQDGIVHQLAIHTIGGVIAAQDTLMLLVPQSDMLVADVQIAPSDIDQAHVGQQVVLKFPAFNQRQTPERKGTVERISPDLIIDPQTRKPYFEARVLLEGEADGFRLMPGMPAQAFFRTVDRTMLSYLTKPFTDYLDLAFRSD